jgi:hypothetical protein
MLMWLVARVNMTRKKYLGLIRMLPGGTVLAVIEPNDHSS